MKMIMAAALAPLGVAGSTLSISCERQSKASDSAKITSSLPAPKLTRNQVQPAGSPVLPVVAAHSLDWPCACDGTPIPAPVVRVPVVTPGKGWPAVMPDNSSAATCPSSTGNAISGFDMKWALPDPSPAELSKVPKAFQDAIKAIQTLPKRCITEADVFKLAPELKTAPCFNWKDTWTIDVAATRTDSWGTLPKGSKPQVFVGATFIRASLAQIGAAELNFVAYRSSSAGKNYDAVYPVNGSYCTGTLNGCPFLRVDVFYKHPGERGFCKNQGVVHFLKHCRDGRFVVDSYADPIAIVRASSYQWNAGRDTFLQVCDESGKFVGWFIVTMYTMNIDCYFDWDGKDICKNLEYMREQAIREK